MSQIGFAVKIVAPYFKEIPPDIKGKWLAGTKKGGPKAYKSIKKAIRTRKDFKEKIAKPTEKAIASFIDPKFISKHGTTYRNIMDKTHDSMKRAGKDYLRGVKDAYEPGRYEEAVERGRAEYAREWCECLGPLKGYKAGGILGLATMAAMALTGDRKLVDYLRERNVIPEGKPLAITASERPGKFKNILIRRIVRWGSLIIELGYEAPNIQKANEALNQLVNEYRREEIIPFSPGGVSHIDFMVEEIPNPVKPGEKIKQLGLEIQVTKKE